jgi:hypothetical protein
MLPQHRHEYTTAAPQEVAVVAFENSWDSTQGSVNNKNQSSNKSAGIQLN